MNNLEKFKVTELSTEEMQKIEGGSILGAILVGLAVGALVGLIAGLLSRSDGECPCECY